MVVIGCVGVDGRLLGATGGALGTTVLSSRGAAVWAVADPVPLDSVAV
jgi:hypothetical protein